MILTKSTRLDRDFESNVYAGTERQSHVRHVRLVVPRGSQKV